MVSMRSPLLCFQCKGASVPVGRTQWRQGLHSHNTRVPQPLGVLLQGVEKRQPDSQVLRNDVAIQYEQSPRCRRLVSSTARPAASARARPAPPAHVMVRVISRVVVGALLASAYTELARVACSLGLLTLSHYSPSAKHEILRLKP